LTGRVPAATRSSVDHALGHPSGGATEGSVLDIVEDAGRYSYGHVLQVPVFIANESAAWCLKPRSAPPRHLPVQLPGPEIPPALPRGNFGSSATW